MVRAVKCLLSVCRHEVLNVNPRHPHKKLGVVAGVPGEAELVRALALVELVNCRVNERPFLNNQCGTQCRKYWPDRCLAYVHMQTSAHT